MSIFYEIKFAKYILPYLKAGVHFKVVQVRLGHSSFQQTMDTYSHVLPDIEEEVVDKLIDLV